MSYVQEFESYLLAGQREQELSEIVLKALPAAGQGFTGPEVYAKHQFNMLAASNSMERRFSLQITVLQGVIIQRIAEGNLWNQLGYDSLEGAIESETKLSRTQISVVRNAHEVIFPILWERYCISPMDFWEKVSKSNMADIIPHMTELLTGKGSKSEGAKKEVAKLLADNAEQEDPVKASVEALIEMASGTNKDLRANLRHESTPPVDFFIVERNGEKYLVAPVSEDQIKLANRVMREHATWGHINLDKTEPMSVPLLREMVQ